MNDRDKLRMKAGKVARSILEDPDLAYFVCIQLNGATLGGPWERHPEMRMLGRLAPTAPGTIKRFICSVEYTGSHFEWRALKDTSFPGPSFLGDKKLQEERMQLGKSTTLSAAMQAADRRLTEQGWQLLGSPLVTDKWVGNITKDEFTRQILPGALYRYEAETGGEIIAIRWGDVTTKDGHEIEGLLLDTTTIEDLQGQVIEKRHNEGWEDLILRGQKLVDDTLRRIGWMVGWEED